MAKKEPIKVLFVCMGNICRSPTAHGVFESMVKKTGLQERIHVQSAGTHGYHLGELPHETTRKVALDRGYELKSRAQQFHKKHFTEFDYVVAMGEDNYDLLLRIAEKEEHRKKMIPFITLCKSFKDRHSEVPDPYYGGGQGFELVLDICIEGCEALLEHIKNNDLS